MKKIEFQTCGTCSKKIEVHVIDDVVEKVKFSGGCTGNLQAIAMLAKGRKTGELADLLEGIQCQNGTSCPDQLSKALRKITNKKA